MIRRHLVALRIVLMVADAVSASALFVGVASLRFGTKDWSELSASLNLDLRTAAGLYGLGWAAILGARGMYLLRSRWTARAEFYDILRCTAVLIASTLGVLYLFKMDDVSRLFLLVLFVSQPILTVVSRWILRSVFTYYRERGRNLRYMVVVGAGPSAEAFAETVEGFKGLGMRVIGHLAGPGDDLPAVSRPVLGSALELEDVLHDSIVDEVAVVFTRPSGDLNQEVLRLCADEGKTVRIPLETYGPGQDGRLDEFEGLTLFSLTFGPTRAASLVVKRAIDVALALAGLVVLSPVLLAVALRIRIVDGAPVLFRQTRVGLHGREFTCYKFRTMIPDAESRLASLQHLNERQGPAFKITGDPRITATGRFLRASSLDELPQLYNVLRGHMSLVGPRPPLPKEVVRYDVWHRRRLSMKPGITGLWQIEARNQPSFDRWVERDLSYIDRWSLWLDLKIIARTVPAVLSRAGR